MITILIIWLGAILATEAIVELIVASEVLFNTRDWIAQRSIFFGKLVNCGYCVSVWVAALMFAYYLPIGQYMELLCVNRFVWVITLIAKAVIVHRLSNVLHELFSRWFHRKWSQIELIHTNIGSK